MMGLSPLPARSAPQPVPAAAAVSRRTPNPAQVAPFASIGIVMPDRSRTRFCEANPPEGPPPAEKLPLADAAGW